MNKFPRITFGIIVLNGEPFTRYCLRAFYPFAYEIIVVEGATINAAAIATPDGHSTNGTLEALYRFREEEDPENKVQIITRNDFWSEKNEQSQAYAERATGDYIWQVDIDEFYHPKSMRTVFEMFAKDPSISGVSFYWKNFWGGFDYLVDGWRYRDIIKGINGIRRVFRWGKGYHYVSHRPPTVLDDQDRDLCTLHWISPDETAKLGIFCYHYGMVFPKQARQKTLYYRDMWQSHKDMDTWRRESYLELRHPFRILHGTKPPSWLRHFNGTHPPEIKRLIEDLKQGIISVEERPTGDIKGLLNSSIYQAATVALDLLYYLVTPTMRLIKAVVRRGVSLLTSLRTALLFGEPFFWLLGMRRKRWEIDLSQVKRVLVVRLDEIGDVVMTTPFLRELRQNLPQAWITLVVKPAVYNLVELCPYVNEVLTYDWRVDGPLGALRRHRRVLRLAWRHLWQRRFDLAILPRWDADRYHGTFVLYFSGAPWRVGYSENVNARKKCLNGGFDHLLTHALQDSTLKHEVEHNLDVIRFLGGQVQDDQLELWLGEEDEAFAEEVLKNHSVQPGEVVVGFGPSGGNSVLKQWPASRFGKLGYWLQAEYRAHIVLTGGAGEEPLGLEIQHRLRDSVINLVGKTTLRQMAAVLKWCDIYVGNDAGPMHIAAAMDVPVVALIGPSCPHRFKPWGNKHTILWLELPCSPCFSNDHYNRCEQCIFDRPHCILNITVDTVKQAVVTQLIQKTSTDPSIKEAKERLQ